MEKIQLFLMSQHVFDITYGNDYIRQTKIQHGIVTLHNIKFHVRHPLAKSKVFWKTNVYNYQHFHYKSHPLLIIT